MAKFDYQAAEVEKKWREVWVKRGLYKALDNSSKPKSYMLIEFPYPSGERLHVGHARSYCCLDTVARKRRMQGMNVLYPIGWDAFGLPAENYAIKTGIHPSVTTLKNISNAKEQAQSWGLSFDWDREVNTTDPNYYKWTQWIFQQLFKKGLAYKAEIAVNWCASCKINLANEEVLDGKCERCGAETERRTQSQWILAITKYADRLLEDLNTVNFREDIALQQINWIGKKSGARVVFKLKDIDNMQIEAFTTRIDTLFGVSFVVVAPEVVKKWIDIVPTDNKAAVVNYVTEALNKSERERKQKTEKTGVETGLKVINPANGLEVPVWVAEYVMTDVGTGVVMGVPAHDERDFQFARKYKLPIKQVVAIEGETHSIVIKRSVGEKFTEELSSKGWYFTDYEGWAWGVVVPVGMAEEYIKLVQKYLVNEPWYVHTDGEWGGVIFKDRKFSYSENEEAKKYARSLGIPEKQIDWDKKDGFMFCFEKEGKVLNSGKYDGITSEECRKAMVVDGLGELTEIFHLRDWVFSRQHYWGEPIPMIFCIKDGWQPVPEDQLPVKLPEVEKYLPTETGESPLAHMDDWVNTKCQVCGGTAKRETDTMPNWAGSSWYYLRYIDPHNDVRFADFEKLKYWLPVDWYNGGMEHTTLHLLYSRFWHKVLFDIGVVPTAEPYAKRTSHGVILGPDGRKMSKSRGNVINPDEVVSKYGADTLRLYEMFIGPFDQMVAWSWEGVEGSHRFLKKVWTLVVNSDQVAGESSDEAKRRMATLVKKVEEDLETMKFNTAVAAMMEMVNWWIGHPTEMGKDLILTWIILMAPMAPFMAEELFLKLTEGKLGSVHEQKWPVISSEDLAKGSVVIVIQVDGKMRGKIEVDPSASSEKVEQEAMKLENVKVWLEKKKYKVIFVPGRIINFVTA